MKSKFIQLSSKNICKENEFLIFENFKKFIDDHYNLVHMEKYNYIKYVKVKRQIMKTSDDKMYSYLIDQINNTLKILNIHHTFPYLDIKKHMFKLNNIFKLIEEKRLTLYNTLKEVRNIFNLQNEDKSLKIKILIGINSITYRYTLFLKYSKQLIYYINKLMEFEYSYGIDHKIIELNNIERSFLGKKSEYTACKIIMEYISYMNLSKNNNKIYYFSSNVDFLKLFNIAPTHLNNIKGEVDCMIIYKENNIYYIDKIIEVKSSIKATFEDIIKFESLEKHINNIFDENPLLILKYDNYIFTKESFNNILNKKLTNWVIYMCINSQDYIEKSHLFFSTCLKIIDDEFIKDYYIDSNDNIIKKKFDIICNNRDKIEYLFNDWTEKTNLYLDTCNLFISKK